MAGAAGKPVPYREWYSREAHPKREDSQRYNPCKDGHSDDRANFTDWMGFTFEMCVRCGKFANPLTFQDW